ncbi:MAG: hypothetical protein JWM28_2876 [Chitinophagaceae bacterium]|nr:hypothetical protein [Chitinophagaceae bacterium]
MPVLIFFILLNAFFVTGKSLLGKWGVDQSVLILGNLLIFVVTMISYFMCQRGLKSQNPNAFVRSVYGSFIVKFFIFAIAAFVYIQMAKANVNKTALFGCMGLYLVYTFMEVSILTKMLKRKADG